MILEVFMNLILAFLRLVLAPVEIVGIPATFGSVIATILVYLIDGMRILNAFIDEYYIGALLGFVFFVSAIVHAYHLLMWLLRKIPFINID